LTSGGGIDVADGYACVYKWHGHKSKEVSDKEFEKLERLMEKAKRDEKGLWNSNLQVMECLCGGVVTPVTHKQVLSKQTEKNNKAIKQPTAICRDGTYSYSLNHIGSCSHHGGVLRYLNHAFYEKEDLDETKK